MERSMSLKTLILTGWLLVGVVASSRAQLPGEATRIYTLQTNSQLTDDCPICDRIPIVVPMTGTFRLRFLDETPLFTRYELQDISFHAGSKGGPEYSVTGSGTYQVGGEVAVVQDLFLDVEIDNGFEKTRYSGVNSDRSVTQRWPTIQATVNQTNGTAAKVYYLDLVAVPALQFRAIIADHQTGTIRLQWDSNGGQAQLERAATVDGLYSPISPITTNQSFSDAGALTNGMQWFYRLRQY